MLIQQHVFIVSNTKALLASFFPLSTLGSICLFHFRKKDRCCQDTLWDRVVGILGLYFTLLVHHRPKLCITGPQKCMYEQHQDVFGQHQIHLVQVVGNGGKKKQSTTFVLPALSENGNDLKVCPLTISIYEGRWFRLFCFVVMRSTEPGCFRSCSWCLWKALDSTRRGAWAWFHGIWTCGARVLEY